MASVDKKAFRDYFNMLEDDILLQLVQYLPANDLNAMSLAWNYIALTFLPNHPIVWKKLFIHHWQLRNFSLDPDAAKCIDIHPSLKKMFSGYSQSRIYQLLTHAITYVPSSIDLPACDPNIRPISFVDSHRGDSKRKPCYPHRAVDIAYSGHWLGGDRAVRSNVPYSFKPRVAIYAKSADNPSRCVYQVGVAIHSYFEITLSGVERAEVQRVFGSSMVSIGFANAYFHLVDKQPGWDIHSYGYHGDDGRYYHNSGRGQIFGPRFNVGDTVGCGYTINHQANVMELFFTKNGQRIPARDNILVCDLHDEMYPVVGIDSTDAVHFNLGQEPFHYDFVDALFEHTTHADVDPETYLPWLLLSDNEQDSYSSETDDEPMIDSNLEFYIQDMVEMMDDDDLPDRS